MTLLHRITQPMPDQPYGREGVTDHIWIGELDTLPHGGGSYVAHGVRALDPSIARNDRVVGSSRDVACGLADF